MSTTQNQGHGGHWMSYPAFIWRSLVLATEGTPLFYGWMTLLTALALVGINAWTQQLSEGLIVTHMTDQVSWGLYIANFTFIVGLAAGAVMMVIPAYIYHDREMHDIVIIGELLAVAAIVMCLAFVMVDMGRPDRFWHMMPLVGRFNWPISMLTWDVIALGGYLLLNLHICGYLLYTRFLGERPARRWYIPFVFLAIFWAISIHTVTAFLYQGLGGRPFWNTAILAPRFIVSAFVAGPAFIIITLRLLQKVSDLKIGEGAIATLLNILRVTILVNLFLVLSEVFTEFYTGGSHVSSAQYLYFGLHGFNGLVPWIWTAIVFNVVAAGLLLLPGAVNHPGRIILASSLAFVGLWIEKGMGLIVPGFIPSTLHEIVEYSPSIVEWKVMVGIWAIGLMVYTIALKIAIPVLRGEVSLLTRRE